MLLIGHNPSCKRLVLSLASDGAELAAVRRRCPTGALATLEFAGRWRELGPRCATLTGYVIPRQLAEP